MDRLKRTVQTLSFLFLVTSWAAADDLYVKAGASGGDGTKEKPFKAIWKALTKANRGDVIHVVQGEYTGKMKSGFIVIDKPGITLVGGYKDATYTDRNPFLYPTTIKDHPKSKVSSFKGGYIRTTQGGAITEHESTTVDGFWFDRKDQNRYKDGNLAGIPIGSNTKPVIWFQQPDCHIRNCVFLNSALYCIRVSGDGSSIENNLFVNSNYTCIDVYGKNRKLGNDYPFHRIRIRNNTFFMMWNVMSLELGAGCFIRHNGNAELEITDNIFHLSSGNMVSMGWAVCDTKNMKADAWIKFNRNSVTQMRGGALIFYDPDQTANVGIDDLSELEDTYMAEAEDNTQENPFFAIDADWFAKYASRIPPEDVSNKKVKMDHYNRMREMMGLPLKDHTPRKMGKNNGAFYPIENVLKGTFWTPGNASVKNQGIQAKGKFPVVRGKLLKAAGGSGPEKSEPGVKRDYEEVEWDTLLNSGEGFIGKAIELRCYYEKYDSGFEFIIGGERKPYLAGTGKTTHKILKLRNIPDMGRPKITFKGYLKIGSSADNYVKKKARRSGGRGKTTYSFVIRGVVRKPAGKLFGNGPQIVIEIDSIDRK